MHAEWHFFVTSHGKSAGDSAGVTLKRLATRASLQRIYQDQILTALQVYQFAVSNIRGMHFVTLGGHEKEQRMAKNEQNSAWYT